MKLLYLHGLGSSGQSSTALGLMEAGFDVISPDYQPQHYQQSIEPLLLLVDKEKPTLLVGTSMGGYYVLKLAELTGLPVVAVNACFQPELQLAKYLEQDAHDYVTGEAIVFTTTMLASFTPIKLASDTEPTIVIGDNDEIIPADEQKQFCKQQSWSWISTDWGHRVGDKQQLTQIIRDRY
ncbi:MAG: hypothetical protein COA90_01210 [Gammaproteobacteria bacterium]|nr:MAG: hypothetical protein COA90_01210 [Gammaproteobacteria bacterium]